MHIEGLAWGEVDSQGCDWPGAAGAGCAASGVDGRGFNEASRKPLRQVCENFARQEIPSSHISERSPPLLPPAMLSL